MTELVSSSKFPTISFCALVYAKLFNHLEKYKIDERRNLTAINPLTNVVYPNWLLTAADQAFAKLDKYYSKTDDLAYVVGTSNYCIS